MGAWKARLLWLALALTACGWAGTASAKFDLPAAVIPEQAPAGVALRSIALAKIEFDIQSGQKTVELQSGPLCSPVQTVRWRDGLADERSFAMTFAHEFKSMGFNIAGDPSDLFETTSEPPDYLIAAKFGSLDGRYCYRGSLIGLLVPSGGVKAEVEWQIYSSTERRTVARITTVAADHNAALASTSQAEVVRAAFVANVRALINDRQFRDLMAAPAPKAATAAAASNGLAPISVRAPSYAPGIADAAGSVVAIFAGGAFGSGFVIDDGYVLTNNHVAGDHAALRIRWSDGLETSGEVVRSDRQRDVALIRTDTRGRPALALRAVPVHAGDTVFAIGTPLDPKFQNTLTKGVVSAVRTMDGLLFIQSDVMVNHGDSGGPLLDETGKVAGVTVLAYQPDGAPTGINLFIPIKDGLDFLAIRMAPTGQTTAPASVAAAVPQAATPPAPSASGSDRPVTDVAGWIGRNIDATGWTFVGADERAAYFSDAATVASLPNGVLQGAFRSELFNAEGVGPSSTSSERSVWQLDCSNGRVRRIAVTTFRAHNLKDQVTSSFQPNAAWETPDDGSVAGELAKTLCPQTSAARGQ